MMKNQLIELVKKLKRNFTNIVLRNAHGQYSDILKYIDDIVPEKAKDLHILQKVYWILNNLQDFPKCANPNCNNHVSSKQFKTLNKGYALFCSRSCAAYMNCNSAEMKKKSRQTKLERYGDPTWTNAKKSKQTKFERYGNENYNNSTKQKATCLKRYGATTAIHSDGYKEKLKENNIKKFGVPYVVQSEYFKEKRIETCLEHFGVDYPMQSSEVQAKSRKTSNEKYGVDYPLQNKDVKAKAIDTCIQKYGVDNPIKTQAVKDKAAETCMLRYGVKAPGQSHDIRLKQQTRYKYNDICFDSSYELAYYIWLIDSKIKFEYQPKIVFTYELDGKQHFYMPDFKVEDQFVEIKGDQFFKEDGTMQNPYDHSLDALFEAKHQCMIKNNVKILRSIDVKCFIQYVNDKYGKTYLASFKMR